VSAGACFGVACSGGAVVGASSEGGDARDASPLADARDDGSSRSEASADEGSDADAPFAADVEAQAPSLALFNGYDLTGWDTYLGPPLGSQEPVGKNRDPGGVFSVVTVDGSAAIRISGETWGALTTRQEFADYHLRAEFKWGTHAVWPPLTVRDSGLMYHSVGPFGAVKVGGGALADPPLSGYFMTSLEMQIAQGDVGSCYSLGPVTMDDGAFGQAATAQYEKALGSWNSVELFVVGNESVHLVNGQKVVHIRHATMIAEDGGLAPLMRGKIQLESESMEIYFRGMTLEPIDRIPSELL
jgi:hypothetical protein